MAETAFDRTRRNASRGGFDAMKNIWSTFGTTGSPTYQAQPEGTFGPSRAINATLGDALLLGLTGASGVAAGAGGLAGDVADYFGMRPDNADRLGRDLSAMAVEMPWNELAAFAPTLTTGRVAGRTPGLAETVAPDVPSGPLALPAPPAQPRPLALPAPGPDNGGVFGTTIYRPGDGGQVMDVNASITQGNLNGELEKAWRAANRPPEPRQPVETPEVISLSGPTYPRAPRDEDTGILFSQAYQSALDLKQNKGTVGQMRTQLLNSGVKPEELEFRGFDTRFRDPSQKITKQEIIDFFDENDGDVVESQLFRAAEGRTGGDEMDSDDLVERYVEQNLDSEADYYQSDYLPERLNDEYKQVRDLNGEELESLAADQGFDDVDEFIAAHEDDWVIGDDLYSDENRAIEAAFGDPYELAADSLRENAAYGMTQDELREAIFGENNVGFDPGDTTYSTYMLPGVEDYFENVFTTNLPGELGTQREGYGGGHSFDYGDTSDQAFWVRGGRVPQVEGGPANVRALMEIQSDLSQRSTAPGVTDPKGRKPMRRTAAEELEYAGMKAEVDEARRRREEAERAISKNIGVPPGSSLPTRYQTPGSIREAFTSSILDENGFVDITGNRGRQTGGSLSDMMAQEALRQNFMLPEGVSRGDLPPSNPGEAWDPNPINTRLARERGLEVEGTNTPDDRQFEMAIRPTSDGGREFVTVDDIVQEQLAQNRRTDAETMGRVFTRTHSPVQGTASLFDPNDADFVNGNGGIGFATRGVPRFQNFGEVMDRQNSRRFADPVALGERLAPVTQTDPNQPVLPLDYTPAQQELGDALARTETGSVYPEGYSDLAGKEAAAPFQQRDVGPVRAALARQLADAVAEGDSAVVTGSGPMANKFTRLPQSKFYVYDKETPKVLQKILDKAAPGTKVEPIRVNLPEAPGADHRGNVTLMGVRLTPEVKRAIEYNGIPYFSLGGGMVALGAMGGMPGDGEARRPDA